MFSPRESWGGAAAAAAGSARGQSCASTALPVPEKEVGAKGTCAGCQASAPRTTSRQQQSPDFRREVESPVACGVLDCGCDDEAASGITTSTPALVTQARFLGPANPGTQLQERYCDCDHGVELVPAVYAVQQLQRPE